LLILYLKSVTAKFTKKHIAFCESIFSTKAAENKIIPANENSAQLLCFLTDLDWKIFLKQLLTMEVFRCKLSLGSPPAEQLQLTDEGQQRNDCKSKY